MNTANFLQKLYRRYVNALDFKGLRLKDKKFHIVTYTFLGVAYSSLVVSIFNHKHELNDGRCVQMFSFNISFRLEVQTVQTKGI